MKYDYAAQKIEKIYNQELEHIDRIQNLIEPNPNWVSKTNWISLIENTLIEFTAAARTVIEIYIELSMGECEDWRELHKLEWEFAEKLKTTVEHMKEIIDKPF